MSKSSKKAKHRPRSQVNEKKSPSEYTKKAGLYLFAGLVLILPVFVLPASIPIYGPVFKGLIFKLTVLASVVVLLLHIRADSIRAIRYNVPFILLLFSLVLIILASLTSVFPKQAFLGSYIEQEGSIVLGLYLFLAFVIYQFKFNLKELKLLADAAVMGAVLVSIVAIMQYFFGIGVLYAGFSSGLTEKLRPTSTLGNPVYMASYLVLIFPLAMMRSLGSKSGFLKYFHLCAVFLIGLAILISFTRGSWLAAIAELILLFVLLGKQQIRINKEGITSIAIALLLSLIIFIPQLNVKSADPGVDAGGGEGSIAGGSITTRLIMWDGSVRMISASPLTGFGPDTMQYSYPLFGDPKLYLQEGFGSVTRVHNDVLQATLNGGVCVLLIYLFLPVMTVLIALKAHDRANSDAALFFYGIAVSIVGYLLNNLSAFAVIAVAPMFWVMVGMLLSFAAAAGLIRGRELTLSTKSLQAAVIILLVPIVAYSGLMFQQARADLNDSLSVLSFKQGDPEKAVELAESAAKGYPYEPHYRSALANAYYNLVPMPGYDKPLEALESSRKILVEILKENPYNQTAVTNLGNIYYALGGMDDKKYYTDAARYYLRATELNPIYEKNFAFLGNTYYFLEEKDQAKKYYEIAISLDAESLEANKGLAILAREAKEGK